MSYIHVSWEFLPDARLMGDTTSYTQILLCINKDEGKVIGAFFGVLKRCTSNTANVHHSLNCLKESLTVNLLKPSKVRLTNCRTYEAICNVTKTNILYRFPSHFKQCYHGFIRVLKAHLFMAGVNSTEIQLSGLVTSYACKGKETSEEKM